MCATPEDKENRLSHITRCVASCSLHLAAQPCTSLWSAECDGNRQKPLSCLQGLVFNEMRSKTKVIQEPLGLNPKEYPDWSFDGSSTGQAEGNNSDCILK